MTSDQRSRTRRRLSLWLCLNLSIFIACYLNYRLQLKHRYLYKLLNVGLCFSRAAAMVINFNLLLVWLPMCKYTLTYLACLANGLLRRQRLQRDQLEVSGAHSHNSSNRLSTRVAIGNEQGNSNSQPNFGHQQAQSALPGRLARKLKASVDGAAWQLARWFIEAKMTFISSFLIAVDHCKSLHTICATTITIASVTHTVAHLLNVINFSKNFDPFLSNLNMAEHKGQNPLQLLISVPGITGSLMIIILILMSLSSVDIIRNSSYDLFQIFHRLSVVFVILLFLHPSSHVLKEQSNVDRHNPELCYGGQMILLDALPNNMLNSNFTTATSASLLADNFSGNFKEPLGNVVAEPMIMNNRKLEKSQVVKDSSELLSNKLGSNNQGQFKSSATSSDHYEYGNSDGSNVNNKNKTSDLKVTSRSKQGTGTKVSVEQVTPAIILPSNVENLTIVGQQLEATTRKTTTSTTTIRTTMSTSKAANAASYSNAPNEIETLESDRFCLDSRPLFVAQSSICWYVLTIGLSCYLFDLLLRKLRRSKSSIELLDARADCEGNLIELILSNNHKRFAHWLPGQFVYLNCPQIATYEWHPFTISSMDNRSRQFTLHIKTGGDWTRKLREKLDCSHYHKEQQEENSMSLSKAMTPSGCLQDGARGLTGCCPRGQQQQRPVVGSGGKNCTALTFVRSDYLLNGGIKFGHKQHGSIVKSTNFHHLDYPILANLDCYSRSGKLQVECTRLARIQHFQDTTSPSTITATKDNLNGEQYGDGFVGIGNSDCCLNDFYYSTCHDDGHDDRRRYLEHNGKISSSKSTATATAPPTQAGLDLFIDGPFHSPFERLLEQQVSVCIASGVGWTAFSSVFQCITNKSNNLFANRESKDWLSQWYNLQGRASAETASDAHLKKASKQRLADTKLHLMVIVTSIEQLRPFYHLALEYFNRFEQEYKVRVDDQLNSVREITAFITRFTKEDDTVREFCRQERLDECVGTNNVIKVNEVFTIHFGKPDFGLYLGAFSTIYSEKISVYCCGSYQVKKSVQGICHNLNKSIKSTKERPFAYSYHEESF